MKSALLVVLLAVAASAAVIGNDVPDVADMNGDEMLKVILTDVDELTDAVEVPQQTAVATRNSLNLGTIGAQDVLIYNRTITGNRTRRVSVGPLSSGVISAIRVNPLPGSNNANPTLVRGGVGQNFAIIRLTSRAGLEFRYRAQFYFTRNSTLERQEKGFGNSQCIWTRD